MNSQSVTVEDLVKGRRSHSPVGMIKASQTGSYQMASDDADIFWLVLLAHQVRRPASFMQRIPLVHLGWAHVLPCLQRDVPALGRDMKIKQGSNYENRHHRGCGSFVGA